MRFYRIRPAHYIHGKICLPGDKSIAHRSVIISALACGKTCIHNFPLNQDCLTSLAAFKKLGLRVSQTKKTRRDLCFCIESNGLYALTKPRSGIFCGNSGTTFRLLLGVLAGQKFSSKLLAAKGLSLRPMKRVTDPLRIMGAMIKASSSRKEEFPPIEIKPAKLKGITYKLPVASAQVKSALLFAGLYAKTATRIIEPVKTRDHTERMLECFGADIETKGKTILLRAGGELCSAGRIQIPADISSASFFMVCAILLPRSQVVLKSVGLNPARIGIIRVLKRMGANINIKPCKTRFNCGEPVGDIIVKSSRLKGTRIRAQEIPQLIDELPILMVASCLAKGRTVICGAEELRVKETDRVNSMLSNLFQMGADIRLHTQRSKSRTPEQRIIIEGVKQLSGGVVSSFSDHRTAMSMIIAGLVSKAPTYIDDVECISKSFPAFLNTLEPLVK